MTATTDDFLAEFRKRRAERWRLLALADKAAASREEASQAVAERVIQDLQSRCLRLEEEERQALKEFVAVLKKRKQEIADTELELEELPFRLTIGEIDDVEIEIRRESRGLRIQDLKRTLDRELKDYKALRQFLESDEEAGGESTVMFDSLKMSGGLPAAAPAATGAGEAPVETPVEPPPVEARDDAPPENDSEAGGDGLQPQLVRPISLIPSRPEQPEESSGELDTPLDAPLEVDDRPPEAPPEEAPELPELDVAEPGLESLIVDRDFVTAETPAADGDDDLADLAQLDELSRSLEEMQAAALPETGDLQPIPMPAPVDSLDETLLDDPDQEFEDEGEEATIIADSMRKPGNAGQPVLILKGEARTTYRIKLGVSTIGRGMNSTCVLDDRAVSRKHATLTIEEDGSVRLTDLGSENGTYVNGSRIQSRLLKDGDEVQMGKSTLVFSSGA